VTRRITVAVVGGAEQSVTVADEPTYGDLIRAVGLRPAEATALVEDRPVAADSPVPDDADRVRVLRLVRGGGPSARATDLSPADRTGP
jgi:sulfur carrier protein ThiS